MAFFDKLNDLAKSVKDAANDAVETTRIKSRISSEKRAVDEACRKIGEYYYAKRAGDMGPVDDDILEYCIEIDEHSGFCFGVVTAIRKAEEETRDPSCKSRITKGTLALTSG